MWGSPVRDPQSFGVVGLRPTELVAPPIIGGLGDLQNPAQLARAVRPAVFRGFGTALRQAHRTPCRSRAACRLPLAKPSARIPGRCQRFSCTATNRGSSDWHPNCKATALESYAIRNDTTPPDGVRLLSSMRAVDKSKRLPISILLIRTPRSVSEVSAISHSRTEHVSATAQVCSHGGTADKRDIISVHSARGMRCHPFLPRDRTINIRADEHLAHRSYHGLYTLYDSPPPVYSPSLHSIVSDRNRHGFHSAFLRFRYPE